MHIRIYNLLFKEYNQDQNFIISKIVKLNFATCISLNAFSKIEVKDMIISVFERKGHKSLEIDEELVEMITEQSQGKIIIYFITNHV